MYRPRDLRENERGRESVCIIIFIIIWLLIIDYWFPYFIFLFSSFAIPHPLLSLIYHRFSGETLSREASLSLLEWERNLRVYFLLFWESESEIYVYLIYCCDSIKCDMPRTKQRRNYKKKLIWNILNGVIVHNSIKCIAIYINIYKYYIYIYIYIYTWKNT